MPHRPRPWLLALLVTAIPACVGGEIDGIGPVQVRVDLRGDHAAAIVLSGPADGVDALVDDLRAGLLTDEPIDGGGSLHVRVDDAELDLVLPVVDGVDPSVVASIAAAAEFTVVSSGPPAGAIEFELFKYPARFALCPDYRGDGHCDAAIWRPSTGEWWIRNDLYPPARLGKQGDSPTLGDFDGDGRTDLAVVRPTGGEWRVILSNTARERAYFIGGSLDNAVPGDYDGDGKTDPAVYKASLRQIWVLRSRDGLQSRFQLPVGGYPLAADVDGDGKSDPCVVDRPNLRWTCLPSATGGTWSVVIGQPTGARPGTSTVPYVVFDGQRQRPRVWGLGELDVFTSFGTPTWQPLAMSWQADDRAVVADDGNDGISDYLLWNPTSGLWHGLDGVTAGRSISFFWGGWGDIAIGARMP